MTVESLSRESIDLFRQSIIAKGAAENTVKAYATDLKMLLMWYTKDLSPIHLNQLEERASNWLNSTRLEAAPRTTGRRLVSVRAFAKWTGKPYLLGEYRTPTAGRPIPHPIAEGKRGMLDMVAHSRNANEKAIVGLCGFAGLRISEALSITISSLDLRDRLLVVRGKGDKVRTVPISDNAMECITDAFVKAVATGNMKTPLISFKLRHASQCVKDMGVRASIGREISSHDLRHTYASLALDSGANIRVVQELLGHASSSTTEGYTNVHVDSMRSAVNF